MLKLRWFKVQEFVLRENHHQFLLGSFPPCQVCSHKTLEGFGSLGRCPGPDTGFTVPASLPYLANKRTIRDPALLGHKELSFICIAMSRRACQPQLHAGLLAGCLCGGKPRGPEQYGSHIH